MKNLKNKLMALSNRAVLALTNNRGEGFVDTGIKILISVVVGAVLLAGLYALFDDTTAGQRQARSIPYRIQPHAYR